MKTKLAIILAFVANTMSAQMLTQDNEKLDTLCQTKFTAIYQYSINTADARTACHRLHPSCLTDG